MEKRLFRRMVKWFGILLLAHFLAMLVFGIILSTSVTQMVVEDELLGRAKRTVFIYDLVVFVIASIVYSSIEVSFNEHKKMIKDAVREEGFDFREFLKATYLKDHLIRLGIYAAFQIPYLIFFAVWGAEFQYPTTFEQFYIMDTGAYALTGIAILGFLINILVFGTVFTLTRLLFIFLTKRDQEKNIMR